jgi:hypothetical protein
MVLKLKQIIERPGGQGQQRVTKVLMTLAPLAKEKTN